MSRKKISPILIVCGGVLLFLSLIADLIGLGTYPGINWTQLTGIGIGVAVLILGIWLGRTNAEKGK